MAKSTAKKKPVKSAPKKAIAKKKIAPKKKPAPSVNWLAEGYLSITPFLTVKDPAAAIKFYQKAFGFTKKFSMTAPDGKVNHGEVMYEGSVFMVGRESEEQKMFAPSRFQGSSLTLYVYTPNVNALCKKAKKAGAVCVQEPQDMYWGDRICILFDPDGYMWMFATHVKDVAPEDMHP